MIHVGISAICFLQIALGVFADGYYTVIAPGTIHSAHKYNATVAVHKVAESCTLKIGITGPSYNETKTVELTHSDGLKLLQFDVPDLEEGVYNLTAEGVAGLIFHNTTQLNYAKFEPYVMIQTDKGTYKPGDEVKYRLIFVDENLKPTRPVNSTVVSFEDNKRNRIKEIRDIEVVKGVYSGKLQLSDYAGLGHWTIAVKSGNTHQASFYVDKYVLPKFTIKAEVTERVAVQDGDMHAVVRANYTYGKPVNGKVTLLVQVWRQHWHFYSDNEKPSEIPPIVRTADMVGGKAKFDFSVKEYASKIDAKYPSSLIITATVEEEFTGVKLNGTAYSTLYPYRYEMMCADYQTCVNYHPDKETEVVIQILHVDGSQVQDTKSVVRLTYVEKYWSSRSQQLAPPPDAKQRFQFEAHLNSSSMAVFKVKLPELPEVEGFGHYFEVTAEYADEKKDIVSTQPYREPRKTETTADTEPKDYLRVYANFPEEKYSLDEDVKSTITVNSSRPLNYFVYTIVGRGNILHVERVELAEPTKVTTFDFVPTYAMAPYASIYVHYVEQGEYYYAETNVHINWEFKNKISIEAPPEVKVGDKVSLKITTQPNSFVGLLAVDQSALLLGSGNDIQEYKLKWKLGAYSTYTPDQGGYSPYPGTISGLVTLTNANYFYNRTKPIWDRHMIMNDNYPSTPVRQNSPSPALKPLAAGAAAFAGASSAPIVRKDFVETWIFADIERTDNETFTWVKKIPDTITSWAVSGFSLNPETGFAATKEATNIKAFLPFFISIRLPYSVKRGELISVPALVFNYLSKDLDVEITLENTDDEFEFIEASNEVISVQKLTKMLRVAANSAKGVSYLLRPKVIGNILLKFTAVSPVAGDAIHKPLKVVPEGITQYVNRAFFVNLKDASEAQETFELQLPADSVVVPDSEHAEFTVIGDLLGPLLNNFEDFVRLPTGCGEQTMSSLTLNFLIMRYLQTAKKINNALEARIKSNLERGLQNLLQYQHEDGSFSSFGPSTDANGQARNGSTWLTAYVIRFLPQFGEIIDTDSRVIEKGLKYLVAQQAPNGSFLEAGDVFYQSQRNQFTLTSSACLALLQAQKTTAEYDDKLAKALEFIALNIAKSDDLRIKSLASYTLHQAKHPSTPQIFSQLLAQAKTDGDRRWWSSSDSASAKGKCADCWWWRWARSDEVETTSYVLLSLLEQEPANSEDILQVIKWLVAQRNSYGGFASTQDTVVGLQALIKFAEKSGYLAAEMRIDFKTHGGRREKEANVTLNEANALLLQTIELPVKTKSLDFQAQGKGSALVQVSYQYNIFEEEPAPSFSLDAVVNTETPAHKLELHICVEYVGENGESNMAVMEVTLPSGYEADVSSQLDRLKMVDRVRHIETKNSETTLVIYFESLKQQDRKCFFIEAFKSFAVALQKPAPVIVYDYYDTSKKATKFYEVVSKICDICDSDDDKCNEIC